jgi:hypothetical protein
MQPQANSRASLLANLRTGGVRSVSGAVPHSAGPTGSFQIPRFASQSHGYTNGSIYEDDEDLLAAQMQQMNFGGNSAMGPRSMMNAPMTAGISGATQFQQQQLMMMQMLQQQAGMGMNLNGASPAL